MMRKPFAITLDPGSSLANHTGTWRTFRPHLLWAGIAAACMVTGSTESPTELNSVDHRGWVWATALTSGRRR